MNLLLDTHIAIWALNDDPALSEKARKLLLDPDNTVYYSTVWTKMKLQEFSHLFSKNMLILILIIMSVILVLLIKSYPNFHICQN